LTHVYFGVNLELAWRVATRDAGTLKQSIQGILRDLTGV
jgi:uncharacterized protein with HEPN domain